MVATSGYLDVSMTTLETGPFHFQPNNRQGGDTYHSQFSPAHFILREGDQFFQLSKFDNALTAFRRRLESKISDIKKGFPKYSETLYFIMAGATRLELATSGVTGRFFNISPILPPFPYPAP